MHTVLLYLLVLHGSIAYSIKKSDSQLRGRGYESYPLHWASHSYTPASVTKQYLY